MEHIERELCSLVALFCGLVQIAEVGGHTGDTEHAGLLVEDGQHIVDADVVLVHYKLHCARIEVAAAGAHRQADQRRKAHRGVDALAAVDRADGGAVAEMAGYELQFLSRSAHDLGAVTGDIAVGSAVEAVAADAVILIVFVRHSVHICLARHGLMESGVEHCDHGHVAHDGLAGLDAGEVRGVVQRSERDALFDSVHDRSVNENGLGELLAAVEHTVADSVYLTHGGDHAVLGAYELVDRCGDSLGMRGHGDIRFKNLLVADQRGVLEMTVNADALAQALGHDLFGLHVDQLILKRGAAGIDNKDLHYLFSFLL